MDSLDALPSVDYTSLLTISSPNERDGQQSLEAESIKAPQEHIYAQVMSNGPSQEPKPIHNQPEDKRKHLPNVDSNANNIVVHNTYVLKKPAVTYVTSASDVKSPSLDSSEKCPKKFESSKVSKVQAITTTEPKNESSVFSISGRRVVVSTNFKANNALVHEDAKEKESGLLPPNESWQPTVTDSRTEKKRRKLQVCTDCLSLFLFVPGTILCIISPWLLVPVYIIPNFAGTHFSTMIWITCISSALLVFLGCMVGNVVWYKKGHVWKCLLHCGRGPKNHYWGDSLTSPLQTV
ncbi:hypothetical protein JTE90_022978 [Oedothorax gibbosus]|uniref:Uncharacterized protein n=1 Tax=Oedothorax gibbosus TaxID=931172 RepID=A0AAV6VBT7_9ARAC|nr:hypothetical protein JTE90_022978 [Oedothorax gibbosus]